jgi:hypothetical protein
MIPQIIATIPLSPLSPFLLLRNSKILERREGRIVRAFAAVVLQLLAVAVSVLGAPSSVIAQNVVQFSPGDAYFYSSLTSELLDSLPRDGGTITLDYDLHDEDLGSTAGFQFLRIEGVSPKLIQNLRRAYVDHRKDAPKVIKSHDYFLNPDGSPLKVEANAPHLLVYNTDVDFSDQRIALKYNEDWPHLPASALSPPGREWRFFGTNRAEVYWPLVKTYDAVVEDWQNAHRFKGLQVEVPKNVAWGFFGKPIEEPVVARADDIQIIVAANGKLEKYFRQEPNLPFYRVAQRWVKKCTWRKRAEDEGDDELLLEEKVLDDALRRGGRDKVSGREKVSGRGREKGREKVSEGREKVSGTVFKVSCSR